MQFDFLQSYLNHFLNSPVFTNIKAGHYEWEEVRAISASALLLVFMYCAFRGRRLSLGSLFWYYWFMVVGLGGIFIEGYSLLFTQRVSAGTNILDVIIRMYSGLVDSRFANMEEVEFRILSAISTFVSSPLALLVACSIQQQTSFQYPAQLIVSTVRSVYHAFALLTNASKGFVYTSVIPEQETSLIRSLPVQLFVVFHGVLLAGSVLSLCKSMLKIACSGYSCNKKSYSGREMNK